MEITCRVYKPRQPRESPLFRLVEAHLEFREEITPAVAAAVEPAVAAVLEELAAPPPKERP